MPGERRSHYELLDKLGEGGMGVLYRARDLRLNRTVALKVIRPEIAGDGDMTKRLLQEARTASALSHPHIVTIYDVDEQDNLGPFIAMEYIEGEPLAQRLQRGPLPVAEALTIAIEAAEGLAAAHAAGIVHRDVKPANVMLTVSGHVKLLDFGLAKLRPVATETDQDAVRTLSQGPRTRTGAILGTPAYMSPEQVEGRPADVRSDVFSFGALVYELLTGMRPFQGTTEVGLLSAILRDAPKPVRSLRPEAPEALARIVDRCLEKRPEARYASAEPLLLDLRSCRERLEAKTLGPRWRQPAVLALGGLLVALLGLAGWAGLRLSRERAARRALHEATERLELDGRFAAFRRARDLRGRLAGDPEFERLWKDVALPTKVVTEPAGAEVFIKDYSKPEAEGERLGLSPIPDTFVPFGLVRWRLTKEGFEPLERTTGPRDSLSLRFRLEPRGSAPPGMVRVPADRFAYGLAELLDLPDWWLDVYEVTNRQFKEFVDRGGYRTKEHWKQPFRMEGRPLTFEQAMALFRDSTGRPGPATWELGSFPEGQADFPVSGVSWYEAAAYADFAGKSLPTLHHWFRAAGLGIYSEILGLSNFGGRGPAPVGSHQGLSPWGSYDMAGNVREWVWNAAGTRRYILGGGFNDASYFFDEAYAADPCERGPTHGFRCARYDAPAPAAAFAPIEQVYRDYAREQPASDEVFATYARLYAYDPAPLKAQSEGADDSAEGWRTERVSFTAAYGHERIPARLYLPKNTRPPYQTILYFPSGAAEIYQSSDRFPELRFSFLMRSGRAVLFPVYQGLLERREEGPVGPNAQRDGAVQMNKDARRALDYLASRPDIDAQRLGYYGASSGSNAGVRIAALDARLRAVVLVAAGLALERLPPEIDRLNFAPRVKAPVLIVNGRNDFMFPLEASQRPLYRLLGTPAKDKRLALIEGGHALPNSKEMIRETLDWFDRYLGPVAPPN